MRSSWPELPGDDPRYVVIEELGAGGMGLVLRAYDPKLQREVAIKILKPGEDRMPGSEGFQRLVAEARAMAKLSHPNVVEVFDVDEVAGNLALVMEYVPGSTLYAWLEGAAPRWPEILEAFDGAGQGLAAAHDAGVLHRDFKPANVLIDLETWAVKVTDFGLAKRQLLDDTVAAGSEADEAVTRDGFVMGTPRYMAPEQHLGRALTPAADQFAFCVALWEALCGSPPFVAHDSVAGKLEGPPVWAGASRGPDAVPRRITDALRRGMSPDPSERFEDMKALLHALAPAPKRSSRRIGIFAGGAALVVAGAVAIKAESARRAQRCTGGQGQLVGVWDEQRRSDIRSAVLAVEADYAKDAWPRLEAALDTYASRWVSQYTEACEATVVREEQSAQTLDRAMGCLHRAKVGLTAAADVLARIDAETLPNAHDLLANLPSLQRCSDAETLAAQTKPPRPEDAERVEEVRLLLAEALAEQSVGHYEAALRNAEEAQRRLKGVEYLPARTNAALQRGRALRYLARYEDAEEAFHTAFGLAMSGGLRKHATTAATRLMHLVGFMLHRYGVARRYAAVARGMAAQDPVGRATVRARLGGMLYRQARYAEAEVEFRASYEQVRAAVGDDDILSASARDELSMALHQQGKMDEAEAMSRAALEVWESQLGPHHPDLATSYNNLGNLMRDRGRLASAVPLHQRAIEIWEASLGPDHPNLASVHANIATVYFDQARFEEALREIRRAVEIYERTAGPEDPIALTLRNNAAGILQATGKNEEAEAEHRAILEARIRLLGPDHPNVAQSRTNLATALQAQGNNEEAAQQIEGASRIKLARWGPRHPKTIESRASLAAMWLKLGRVEEATVLAEDVYRVAVGVQDPPENRGYATWVLSNALRQSAPADQPPARAVELAKQALAAYRESDGIFSEAEEIKAWLQTIEKSAPRQNPRAD